MLQFSDVSLTTMIATIATQFPAGARCQIWDDGAAGADVPAITAAPVGTMLCEIVLPANPWAAVVAGSKQITKQGNWTGNGVAAGNGTYFRMLDAAGTDANGADNTHQRIQGLVGATGSGADMELDNTDIAVDQVVTIGSVTLSAANA